MTQSGTQLPTKWMKFYLYFYLPLHCVVELVNLVNVLSLLSQLYPSLSKTDAFWYSLYVVWQGLFLGLTVFTSIFMIKRREKGYYANYIYLIIGGLSSAAAYVTMQNGASFNDNALKFIGFIVFYGAVFVLPNVIYFRKRRDLFD